MLSLAKQSLEVYVSLRARDSCSPLRVAVWSQSVGPLSVLAANANVPELGQAEIASMLLSSVAQFIVYSYPGLGWRTSQGESRLAFSAFGFAECSSPRQVKGLFFVLN